MLCAIDGAVTPADVQLDSKDGRCIAATIRYPKKLTFEQMRRELNKEFGAYEVDGFADEPLMGLWRVEPREFAIQLTETKNQFHVIYLAFQSEQDVIDNMEKWILSEE